MTTKSIRSFRHPRSTCQTLLLKKITICATGDTCSEIQAIGLAQTMYYNNRTRVWSNGTRQASLCVAATERYESQSICSPRTKPKTDGSLHVKLKCLTDRPTFDWLIGNRLLNALGWESWIISDTIMSPEHWPSGGWIGRTAMHQVSSGKWAWDRQISDHRRGTILTQVRSQKVTVQKRFGNIRIWFRPYTPNKKQVPPSTSSANHIHSKSDFLSKEYWMKPDNKADVQNKLMKWNDMWW